MMGIHHFAIARIFYQTLVGCSCREVGDKGQDEIDCHTHKDTAEHKIQLLVMENIFES